MPDLNNLTCPVDKNAPLHFLLLEDNLRGFVCPTCGGVWMNGADYRKWREGQTVNTPEDPNAPLPQTFDTAQAKLCPEDGQIMMHYRIREGFDFALDGCAFCGGVWLDKNEWPTLRVRGLHDDLNRIFTDAWQKAIRNQERAKVRQEGLAERFGASDYAEMRRVRDWLQSHPKRSEILAYWADNNLHR